MFHIHRPSAAAALLSIHFDSELIKIMRNNFFVCPRNTRANNNHHVLCCVQRNAFRLRTEIRFQLAPPKLALISPARFQHTNFSLRKIIPVSIRHPCKCCDYLPLLIYANSSVEFSSGKLDARQHTPLVVLMSHRKPERTENYFSHDIKQLDSNWKNEITSSERILKTFKS